MKSITDIVFHHDYTSSTQADVLAYPYSFFEKHCELSDSNVDCSKVIDGTEKHCTL